MNTFLENISIGVNIALPFIGLGLMVYFILKGVAAYNNSLDDK